MPVPRKYSAGSIIYFVNDIGEDIFVLQQGRVVLISTSLDQKEDMKEEVQRGEFFGVKSALGHYPREETAQVLSDSLVLVFKVTEFEAFSVKNSRIVLQMLKVFSSQLRKIHKSVRQILGEDSALESSVELLRVAEYYYRQNKTDHALYAYDAYIRHYPDGAFIDRARRMSQSIKKGEPFPLDVPKLDEEIERVMGHTPIRFGDYSQTITSDNTMGTELEPPPMVGFDDPASGNDETIADVYARGLDLFAQSRFAQAIEVFEQVLQTKTLSGNSDVKVLEKALYDQARSYLKMSKNDSAIEKLSTFLKKYPRSDNQKKAMLFIALALEQKKEIARAIGIYEKVAQMPPKDKDSIQAETKAKKLRGG